MQNTIKKIIKDLEFQIKNLQSDVEVLKNGNLERKFILFLIYSCETTKDMDEISSFIKENMKTLSFHKPMNDIFKKIKIVFNDGTEFESETHILPEYLYLKLYSLT